MIKTQGLSRYPVYMDHHATTPVDKRVLEEMYPFFNDNFGNASSIDHEYGLRAKQAVDKAREQIAKTIHANPSEIIFTSGATESDNLALIGVAEKYSNKGNHIITCVTEHPAVLDTCRYLERNGFNITYLPVDSFGMVDPDDLRKAIKNETILISIMSANNEIGTIAPIFEIGKIAKEYEILFHTDASQAIGQILIDVEEMNINLLSMSAHKIYGPKGIGALYVRKIKPRVRLEEQLHGGGHERGIRSGTLNVPGIIGFGKAAEISLAGMSEYTNHIRWLRDNLWKNLKNLINRIELNGHPTERLPNNLSVCLPGIESRSILIQLKDQMAISTGSACTTTKIQPSHVIMALGFGEERAHSSLRFGLGRENNENDIEYVSALISQKVKEIFTRY